MQLPHALIHVSQLTLNHHNPFLPLNNQVHLAMPRTIQILKFKPLPMFRARNRGA